MVVRRNNKCKTAELCKKKKKKPFQHVKGYHFSIKNLSICMTLQMITKFCTKKNYTHIHQWYKENIHNVTVQFVKKNLKGNLNKERRYCLQNTHALSYCL